MSGLELVLSDRRGIYIPQNFAEIVHAGASWRGVTAEDIEVLLAGPEHTAYWDTWDWVLSTASFVDSHDRTWYLYQDGDLWLYNEELMDDEEYYNFFGNHREKAHETDYWYDTSAELQ